MFFQSKKRQSFIGMYEFSDKTVCDDLISYFHNNIIQSRPGAISMVNTGERVVRKDLKESLDIEFTVEDAEYNPIIKSYLENLSEVCEKYKKEYNFCQYVGKWKITEEFNLLYYYPGSGYKQYHTERGNANNDRNLVFLTYLNDVKNGGETEFLYQQIKVKPKKGLTLIWPADWTHVHRGIVSNTEDKYIMTGWYNFY